MVSHILKLNDPFLFACPELIEELAGATDLKFGMRVENVVTRNKTRSISDISTNFWERWQNVLAYQIWEFNLVPLLWPIRFEDFNQIVWAFNWWCHSQLIEWLSSAYHWPIVFTNILTNTTSPYIIVANSLINIIRRGCELINNTDKTPEVRVRRTHSVRKLRSASQRSGLYILWADYSISTPQNSRVLIVSFMD